MHPRYIHCSDFPLVFPSPLASISYLLQCKYSSLDLLWLFVLLLLSLHHPLYSSLPITPFLNPLPCLLLPLPSALLSYRIISTPLPHPQLASIFPPVSPHSFVFSFSISGQNRRCLFRAITNNIRHHGMHLPSYIVW